MKRFGSPLVNSRLYSGTPSPANMPKQHVKTNEKCVECNKMTGCDSWLSCESVMAGFTPNV